MVKDSNFVLALWEAFQNADPLTQTAFVISFLSLPILGSALTFWRGRGTREQLREARLTSASLEKELATKDKELETVRNERDQWIPERWLFSFRQEVEQGNEQKGFDILESGYSRISEKLGDVVLELATHHCMMSANIDGQSDVDAARKFSQLGILLKPDSSKAHSMLGELDLLDTSHNQIETNQLFPSRSDVAISLVGSLLEVARKQQLMGQKYVACALYRRAYRTMVSAGLMKTQNGLIVWIEYLEALKLINDYEAISSMIDVAMSSQKQITGEKSIYYLRISTVKFELLMNQRKFSEAGSLYRETNLLAEKVYENDVRALISQKFSMLNFLSNSDRSKEYLVAIESLAKEADKEMNEDDGPSTYDFLNKSAIKIVEIDFLKNVGLLDKALEKARQLVEYHEPAIGEKHPIALRSLRRLADLLSQLGYADEAEIAIRKKDHLSNNIDR